MGSIHEALLPALCIFLLLASLSPAVAEPSVSARVDRNRMSLGESGQFTITIQGTQQVPDVAPPQVDGLTFNGPSVLNQFQMVNGQTTHSVGLVYQVTPSRTGEFAIPPITLRVEGREFVTEAIPFTVEKGAVQTDLKDKLFAAVKFNSKKLYVGQTAPIEVYVYLRQDLPIRGVSGYQVHAEGLNYKFLPDAKRGNQTINGQDYHIFIIEGTVSPSKPGQYTFGSAVVKIRLGVRSKRRAFDDSIFEQLLGTEEFQEVPVVTEPLPIEVVDLPAAGKPANFRGAVGEWALGVHASPTEVGVGDPITLTIKVSGQGNIDTVPLPSLGMLDQIKTYEPTVKTTKNDLGTAGERMFEQVLIPKSAAAQVIPAIELVFFDPVAEQYKVARSDPIPLVVKPGSTGQTIVVEGGGTRRVADETLGEDIVYLKGNLGPASATRPFVMTATFCVLNILPIVLVAGGSVWKNRSDRLRRDVAYARRSRAAKNAQQRLANAGTYDDVQRALQEYLGDRLNIPSSGITAAIVDERLVPRGISSELAGRVKDIFETCDQARFAGNGSDPSRWRELVVQAQAIIDELEGTDF